MLEASARRYEHSCRRHKTEAKGKVAHNGEAGSFGMTSLPSPLGGLSDGKGGGEHGARYHGGANPKRQALSVPALRPAVLAELADWIQINQPRHQMQICGRKMTKSHK
jgi:hypothetical protein